MIQKQKLILEIESKFGIAPRLSRDNTKVFPLSYSVRDFTIVPAMKWVIPLAVGTTKKLVWRFHLAYYFVNRMILLKKYCGQTRVVKQLKADHVALQRAAAGNPLRHMRDLEPDIVLWRVDSNGYPSIIRYLSKQSRHLVGKGDPSELRFWFTLFSLYRILECDFKPKLATITQAFSGSPEGLNKAIKHAEAWNPFMNLKGSYPKDLVCDSIAREITPSRLYKFTTAGPSSNPSVFGIFRDAHSILSSGMGDHFRRYLTALKTTLYEGPWIDSIGSRKASYWEKLRSCSEFCSSVETQEKQWAGRGWLGKLAFKEEAAGKLRVFAIVDSWTQSLFRPLHKYLFKVLKQIPNDGTFDQSASVRRLQSKIRTGQLKKVYSFDLSAATDRLPIALQKSILNTLTGLDIGDAWASILVDRDYHIPKNNYKIPEIPLRYSVGQPMGALSSWAMLAITHHWMLQHCQFLELDQMCKKLDLQYPHLKREEILDQAKNLIDWEPWTTKYEILGDDLVILDERLANQYLGVAKDLGVEINLNKSIQSNNGSFEFAKRTVIMTEDVSGVCWKQFLNYGSLATVTNTLLTLWEQGRFTMGGLGLILTLTSKVGISFRSSPSALRQSKRRLGSVLIAMMGSLAVKGLIPLTWLAHSLVDGKAKDLRSEDYLPPVTQTVKYLESLSRVSVGQTSEAPRGEGELLEIRSLISESSKVPYPFSHGEKRGAVWKELEPLWVKTIMDKALSWDQRQHLVSLKAGKTASVWNRGLSRIFRFPSDPWPQKGISYTDFINIYYSGVDRDTRLISLVINGQVETFSSSLVDGLLSGTYRTPEGRAFLEVNKPLVLQHLEEVEKIIRATHVKLCEAFDHESLQRYIDPESDMIFFNWESLRSQFGGHPLKVDFQIYLPFSKADDHIAQGIATMMLSIIQPEAEDIFEDIVNPIWAYYTKYASSGGRMTLSNVPALIDAVYYLEKLTNFSFAEDFRPARVSDKEKPFVAAFVEQFSKLKSLAKKWFEGLPTPQKSAFNRWEADQLAKALSIEARQKWPDADPDIGRWLIFKRHPQLYNGVFKEANGNIIKWKV